MTPSVHDQLVDVRTKIRQARFRNDIAALAVLEPQLDRLLDAYAKELLHHAPHHTEHH